MVRPAAERRKRLQYTCDLEEAPLATQERERNAAIQGRLRDRMDADSAASSIQFRGAHQLILAAIPCLCGGGDFGDFPQGGGRGFSRQVPSAAAGSAAAGSEHAPARGLSPTLSSVYGAVVFQKRKWLCGRCLKATAWDPQVSPHLGGCDVAPWRYPPSSPIQGFTAVSNVLR
jgi:hypothetical protein